MAIQQIGQYSGQDRDELYSRRESNGGNGYTQGQGDQLANVLGWFSLGLGLAQVAAPGGMARFVGVSDNDKNRTVMRAVGMREIMSGVGILTQSRPAGWLWTRVGGDVMDLALLSGALNSDNAQERDRLVKAAAAVVGITLLDLLGAKQLSGQPEERRYLSEGYRSEGMMTKMLGDGTVHVHKTITVNRPPEEIYQFWRNFENLPSFMSHLEAVQTTGDRRSHWKAKAPAGMTVEWDAEIVEDRPNERIAWRSLEGASVANSGTVRFQPAPGSRGTEIHVELRYNPPGGKIGAAVAKLFGEAPDQQIGDDLRRFKQVMETGEVVHSDASIHSFPHPARPPAERNR
jgi:uncharacterized membrane protein